MGRVMQKERDCMKRDNVKRYIAVGVLLIVLVMRFLTEADLGYYWIALSLFAFGVGMLAWALVCEYKQAGQITSYEKNEDIGAFFMLMAVGFQLFAPEVFVYTIIRLILIGCGIGFCIKSYFLKRQQEGINN